MMPAQQPASKGSTSQQANKLLLQGTRHAAPSVLQLWHQMTLPLSAPCDSHCMPSVPHMDEHALLSAAPRLCPDHACAYEAAATVWPWSPEPLTVLCPRPVSSSCFLWVQASVLSLGECTSHGPGSCSTSQRSPTTPTPAC